MSGGSGKSATLYGSTQDDPVRKPENRVRGGLLAESLASSGVTKQASSRQAVLYFSRDSHTTQLSHMLVAAMSGLYLQLATWHSLSSLSAAQVALNVTF